MRIFTSAVAKASFLNNSLNTFLSKDYTKVMIN